MRAQTHQLTLFVLNILFAFFHAFATFLALAAVLLGIIAFLQGEPVVPEAVLALVGGLCVAAFAATLAGLHVSLGFGIRRGKRRKLQIVLAVLYLVLSPVLFFFALPGLWGGSAFVTILYLMFSVVIASYAVYALKVCWRR